MDFETCLLCVDAVEAAMASPIGQALQNLGNAYNRRLPFSEKYFNVLDNLYKNKYSSPKSFLDDYNDSIEDTITANNDESEITIAIQSIQQIVNEKMEKLCKFDRTSFRSNSIDFISKMKDNLSIIPDEINDFAEIVNIITHPKELLLDYIYNDDSDIQDFEPDDAEILSLKSQLMRLKKDEDLMEIGKLVKHYEETAIIAPNGTIDFDLYKCSKYTIKLIQGMIATMEVREIQTEEPPQPQPSQV